MGRSMAELHDGTGVLAPDGPSQHDESAPHDAQAHSAEPARRDERTEVALLVAIQSAIGKPATVRAARGLSHFGEHSAGWFATGLVGAATDRRHRAQWLTAAAGVVAAHAASIGVKRVVRRHRPVDPRIAVLVATPSRLSFPSSHATSTTAAAVVYSALTGRNLVPVLVAPMLASRLLLGVHYPTDVLAGAALGGVAGGLVRRKFRLGRERSWGPRPDGPGRAEYGARRSHARAAPNIAARELARERITE